MHYGFLDGDNGTQSIQSKDLANSLLSTLTTQELLGHVDISSLEEALPLSLYDNILIETPEGQHKKISTWKFSYESVIDGSEAHKSVWRGLNLGSFVTDDQKAAISNGTFKGLFLGDYWHVDDNNWRIVDIDYWYGTGANNENFPICSKHHLVIMPDKPMGSVVFNNTRTTDGGYVGSELCTKFASSYLNKLETLFPGCILSRNGRFINAVTNGYASGAAWYETKLEVPSEIMICGTYVYNGKENISKAIRDASDGITQLKAFTYSQTLAFINLQSYWLRDIANAECFSCIRGNGTPGYNWANQATGFRPVFGIKGN